MIAVPLALWPASAPQLGMTDRHAGGCRELTRRAAGVTVLARGVHTVGSSTPTYSKSPTGELSQTRMPRRRGRRASSSAKPRPGIVLQVIVGVGLVRPIPRAVLAARPGPRRVVTRILDSAPLGRTAGMNVIAAVALPIHRGRDNLHGRQQRADGDRVGARGTSHGRALARLAISYGLARAADTIIIHGRLTVSAADLWVATDRATRLSAAAIALPTCHPSKRQIGAGVQPGVDEP